MLYNSFIFIPGVGQKSEQQIWRSGIHTWDQWLSPSTDLHAQKKANLITHCLKEIQGSPDKSPAFYANRMQSRHHWRLFPHFRDKTAYLDIETNGMPREKCMITAIALYGAGEIRTYVQGRNLEDFRDDIQKFEVIVTYNGKSFDIPVIETCLSLKIDKVHLDLRHILANLGFKGGLKGCERQLGINRMELEGVDGYYAVLLWNEYEKTGNRKALETLLAYNIADTVNMETLMVQAYNLNLQETPFKEKLQITLPQVAESPYRADPSLLQRLQAHIFSSPRDKR